MSANKEPDEHVAWGMSTTYKYLWYVSRMLIVALAVFFLANIFKLMGASLPAYFASNLVSFSAIIMVCLLNSLPHPGFTKKELRSSLIWLGIFIAAMIVVALLAHFFIPPILFPGY